MSKPVHFLKLSAKYFLRFLEVFIGLLILYYILFIWGMIFYFGNLSNNGEISIYVRSTGVHTEICMPTTTEGENWKEFIPTGVYEDTSHTEYIAIGWGDKGFFLNTPNWGELKISTALTAVFLPSPTAMHVEYCSKPERSDVCKRVTISPRQYRKLCNYVQGCFDTKKNKVQLISGHGYGLTDNFYEAHGSYHLFRTCNVWTNNALKSASIRTSLFSPFPEGNLVHL